MEKSFLEILYEDAPLGCEWLVCSINIWSSIFKYLSSKDGIRTPNYRIAASSWGISNLDKQNLTICEKLNDMCESFKTERDY